LTNRIFNLNALAAWISTHVRENFFVRSDRSPAEISILPPGTARAELLRVQRESRTLETGEKEREGERERERERKRETERRTWKANMT